MNAIIGSNNDGELSWDLYIDGVDAYAWNWPRDASVDEYFFLPLAHSTFLHAFLWQLLLWGYSL